MMKMMVVASTFNSLKESTAGISMAYYVRKRRCATMRIILLWWLGWAIWRYEKFVKKKTLTTTSGGKGLSEELFLTLFGEEIERPFSSWCWCEASIIVLIMPNRKYLKSTRRPGKGALWSPRKNKRSVHENRKGKYKTLKNWGDS